MPDQPRYVDTWLHKRVSTRDGREGIVTWLQMGSIAGEDAKGNPRRERAIFCRVLMDDNGKLWAGTTDELILLAEQRS